MEKINQALGLQAGASIDSALKVIADLKSAEDLLLGKIEQLQQENAELKKVPGKVQNTAREKLIQEKVNAGLSRQIAEEAVANQEADDKLKAAQEK